MSPIFDRAAAVPFDTAEYRALLALREEILRAPLGMCMTAEDLATEPRCLHFGIFAGGQALAAGVLEIWGRDEFYLKQLAVAKGRQGLGLGRRLMDEIEYAARARAGKRLILHARLTARAFYEKLGYTASGEVFYFATLPHIHMEKNL